MLPGGQGLDAVQGSPAILCSWPASRSLGTHSLRAPTSTLLFEIPLLLAKLGVGWGRGTEDTVLSTEGPGRSVRTDEVDLPEGYKPETKCWRGCHLLARDSGLHGGRYRDLEPGCAESQNLGGFPSRWFSAPSLGLPAPPAGPRDPVPRAPPPPRPGGGSFRQVASRAALQGLRTPRFSIRWSRALRGLPPPSSLLASEPRAGHLAAPGG